MCNLYNWANCFGRFLNVSSEEKEVPFPSKYSQSFPAKTRNIFPESSVWSLGRKLKLFARLKSPAKLPFCELSSGFYLLPRTFRRFLHCRVLKDFNVFWYFSYYVTPFCINTWQFFHRNFMYRHRHFFPRSSLQLSTFSFSLHSIWVWNETMVRSTNHFILQSTFCLPFALTAFVFSNHPTSFRIFGWIPYWYPIKIKDGFPFLV
jgi:hypothetical protein